MEKEYFAHETAVIDDGCKIGKGTKIWHFSHIMKGCEIGENCNIGQNVVVSPGVKLGKNVKVQNNVSLSALGAGCIAGIVKNQLMPVFTHPPGLPGRISNNQGIRFNIFCYNSTCTDK